MSIGRSRLLAAALAGMLVGVSNDPRARIVVDDDPIPPPAPPKPATASYDAPAHPGERQGKRLARQKLDYSASDKCLARIRERLAQGLEK